MLLTGVRPTRRGRTSTSCTGRSSARPSSEPIRKRPPGTNTVDVYVSYLRAKVDKGADRPLIHTVRGVGYVLEDRPR